MRMSSWRWAATPPRTIPSASSGSWRRRKTRGAKIVAVDPRFTRTAAVADLYAPIRPGTDIAFLLGIIRYALTTGRYHEDYVKIHTNAPFLVADTYAFKDGLFSGWDPTTKQYVKDSWGYRRTTPRRLMASTPRCRIRVASCSC